MKPKTEMETAAENPAPEDPAAALAALFSPAGLLKRAEEYAAKTAVKEMERISL